VDEIGDTLRHFGTQGLTCVHKVLGKGFGTLEIDSHMSLAVVVSFFNEKADGWLPEVPSNIGLIERFIVSFESFVTPGR
jgi:hypothetical protein